jgi:DNA-binding CsgD family transcriptional regulator
MATPKTLTQVLSELRDCGSTRLRRSARVPDAAPSLARLVGTCKTLSVEVRAYGLAFRLQGATETAASFAITCVLHLPNTQVLTSAEQAVAALLCEGRTLAQIARLRGVSPNTIKSQVRQVFRKLEVDSRVALVRKLCP